MTTAPEFHIASDPAALALLAAETVIAQAREAIDAHGQFHVALSGGSTPKALFSMLAGDDYRNRVDWRRWQVFFSDERFVPPDSPESNYHMAREALLACVPIPSTNVHPVPTVGVSPEEAAHDYENIIRTTVTGFDGNTPRFDLILLGLGPDGHTASLFPETDALGIRDHLIVPNYVPKVDMWRITFTYPLINAGRAVAFLVQGLDKAERVFQVVNRSADLPASGVQPTDGALLWLLDQTAASRLDGVSHGT